MGDINIKKKKKKIVNEAISVVADFRLISSENVVKLAVFWHVKVLALGQVQFAETILLLPQFLHGKCFLPFSM